MLGDFHHRSHHFELREDSMHYASTIIVIELSLHWTDWLYPQKTHEDVELVDGVALTIGRTPLFKIQDPRCSRQQGQSCLYIVCNSSVC